VVLKEDLSEKVKKVKELRLIVKLREKRELKE